MRHLYSDNVESNVQFLGERARELSDQEVERARSLDAKSAAIVAGSVALIGAGAAFVTRLDGVGGGTGATDLWGLELVIALAGLMTAAGLAVGALAPRVARSA